MTAEFLYRPVKRAVHDDGTAGDWTPIRSHGPRGKLPYFDIRPARAVLNRERADDRRRSVPGRSFEYDIQKAQLGEWEGLE